MKISNQDFLEMQDKYKKEVKKGEPGKNQKGDVTDQTDWIFFDRETLERVLDKADRDPKKGGIKFYLGEYTAAIAEKYHPTEVEKYEGGLTLVLAAANVENDAVIDVIDQFLSRDGGGTFENDGRKCPPHCNP